MPGRGKAWRFLLMALWLAFGGTFQDAEARQDLWLTKAHDARRTGQSLINGPMSIDPAQSWTAETPGAHTLNIGATVTERGVFFGSWGLSRRIPGNPDPRLWDKSDGKLYVSSFRDDDGTLPATLYAFHREPTGPASDADRLKWSLSLEHRGLPVNTVTLAVGSDGTLYVGGFLNEGIGVPVLLAVEDQGSQPVLKWTTPYVELRDGAQFVHGIALREVEGQTQRLYVTTANLRVLNTKEEGVLYAVDPASGAVLASYDPSDDVPEAIGSINSPAIGANGTVYFGVRGRFGNHPVNGQYFAVTYEEAAARFTRLWNVEVDGLVEWNHPAIGPDGGIYAGSSSLDEQARGPTYDEGVTPEGATAYFHALKGPTAPVAVEEPAGPPAAFRLDPVYPNPISTTATFSVETARPGLLRLHIVDVLGRTVRVLVDARRPAGRHTFVWDGADATGRRVAGGVYFARLLAADESATYTQVRKLMVMR